MRSEKLAFPDGRVLEHRDRGDGTYWIVLDGKMSGWGTWLTEAEKDVLQELENKMILGSAIEFRPRYVDPQPLDFDGMRKRAFIDDEAGQWDSRDGKPHKLWNVKPDNNSLKSKTMGQDKVAMCTAKPDMPQLETIAALANELVDQQANLKDRLESLVDKLLGGQPQDPKGLDDRVDNGKFDQIESALRVALRYGSDGHHATGRLTDQM